MLAILKDTGRDKAVWIGMICTPFLTKLSC
jgi:hypothetical protein